MAEFVRHSRASYLSGEIEPLLRNRLKAAVLFLLAIHVAYSLMAWLLAIEPLSGPMMRWAIAAFWALMAASLYWLPSIRIQQLRVVELVMLGVANLDIAASAYLERSALAVEFGSWLAGSDEGLADSLLAAYSVSLLLPFIWLMMLYGMLIPNNWRRTALVCMPIALTPIAIKIALSVRFPDYWALASPRRIGLSLFLLALGFASAVYGTYVINSLRSEAFEARRLGQYRLLEMLGKGAMGEVWKGRHKMLARTVAIKLIRPEVLGTLDLNESNLTLQRFEREAQATSQLSSPHSIAVYDFGITEDGTFYYVMELLKGLDLETLVRRFGPVPSARAIHLLIQACDSLEDAHDSGLIHRDIKPANLFMCRLGRTCDFIKILDFGLVKAPQMDGNSPQLTQAGALLGTPAFVAPEQVLGQATDQRADLYGLGCVAYWLVTGQHLFQEDNAIALMLAHTDSTPEPPSKVSELPIPADFENVILNCLAKSPEDRPADAGQLAGALQQCEDAEKWGNKEASDWWTLHLGIQQDNGVDGS